MLQTINNKIFCIIILSLNSIFGFSQNNNDSIEVVLKFRKYIVKDHGCPLFKESNFLHSYTTYVNDTLKILHIPQQGFFITKNDTLPYQEMVRTKFIRSEKVMLPFSFNKTTKHLVLEIKDLYSYYFTRKCQKKNVFVLIKITRL